MFKIILSVLILTLSVYSQSETKKIVLSHFTEKISKMNQNDASEALIKDAQLSPSTAIDLLLLYAEAFPNDLANMTHIFKHLFPEHETTMVKRLLVKLPDSSMEIINAVLPKNCPFTKENAHIPDAVKEKENSDGTNEGVLGCSSNKDIEAIYGSIKSLNNNDLTYSTQQYIKKTFPDLDQFSSPTSPTNNAPIYTPPKNDDTTEVNNLPQLSPDGN